MSQPEIRELHAKENPSAKHIIILHRISAAQLISLPTELIFIFFMSPSPVEGAEILDLKGKKWLAVVKWVSTADHLLGEKPPLQAVLADKPVSPQDFESRTLCGVITST